MGGCGSGRRLDGKATTDSVLALDVRKMRRDGQLTRGKFSTVTWTRQGTGETVGAIQVRVEADRVILVYRHRRDGEDWQEKESPVHLDWTRCTYGGERPWFRCPSCGLRVAILYGGADFACRDCHRLAYPCQRETDSDRAARRSNKIRERLGWQAGILNPTGGKPKWMRWQTFWKLRNEHDEYAALSSVKRANVRLEGVKQLLHKVKRLKK